MDKYLLSRAELKITSKTFKLVSVIIPSRDEANSIGSLITKIKRGLSGYPYEIIVVDDGSKDETKEVARSNNTIVISYKKNLGKGAAMKTGVENAGGDIIVFLDGDGAHDPEDIPRVIAPILEGEADLVIGSRALPESEVSISPLTRRLSNNLASFIISIIVSFLLPLAIKLNRLFKPSESTQRTKLVWITDCTSGFRAITKEGWQKLDLVSQGFQIETEMIYEAVRNKLTIAQAPISCNWNSHFSHLSVPRDGLKTLSLLARKLMSNIGGR